MEIKKEGLFDLELFCISHQAQRRKSVSGCKIPLKQSLCPKSFIAISLGDWSVSMSGNRLINGNDFKSIKMTIKTAA